MPTIVSLSKGGRTLPATDRPVMRQVGWLGQTGAVYELDDEPNDGREPGSYGPLYVQIGVWEDLGAGKWGIKD